MDYPAEEKYQRMIRAYKRLKKLATNAGKNAVIGSPDARDATDAFFLLCYHLKDHLKKDVAIKRPQDVEDHINKSKPLSRAADLCNSSKHAGLNTHPRSGDLLNDINMAYTLYVPAGGSAKVRIKKVPRDGGTLTVARVPVPTGTKAKSWATAKIILTIGAKQYDALDLATECVRDWDAFLKTHGLAYKKS
jgi:hypothetical protein